MHQDLAEIFNVNLIHSHIEDNGTVSRVLHLLGKNEVRQGDRLSSPTSAATSTHISGVLSPGTGVQVSLNTIHRATSGLAI